VEPVSLEDQRIVELQIGRRPRGLTGVARRCRYGYPQVVRVHPIVNGTPFPTLYWLSCPLLGYGIDRMESAGWVGRLEMRLEREPELMEAFGRARESYIRERFEQLSAAERRDLEARGQTASLLERGIGGITRPDRIKCLHLHVAHELARANPIGALVVEALDWIECAAEKVICSTLERVEQIDQINR